VKIFKYGFLFWLARRVPRALRYHVVIMCAADYSTTPEHAHEGAGRICAMDVAKWLER